MKRKILTLSISLILISVIVTSYLSFHLNMESLVTQKEGELLSYCKLINQAMEEDLQHGLTIDYQYYADVFSEQIGERVTFVRADGMILADSQMGADYVDMDNHKDREEIKNALKKGYGASNRSSNTLGKEYLYVAVNLVDHGELVLVTRVAMEIDRLDMMGDFLKEAALKSAAVGVAIAIILSIIFAFWLTKPIKLLVGHARKISGGDYTSRVSFQTNDELQELGETLNEMAEQLHLAVEEMEKAETIRREFVANVTHELKTPLTSISGFVETLQDGADENPQIRKKFLDIISVEASRLKRLIDDILIVSDIEGGREINTDTDINVKEVIEEIIVFLEPEMKKKAISVETTYPYEIYIGGNRDRFKQMMLNLIENAMKYSNENGKIKVTVKKLEEKISIAVEDNGIGIAQEHLPRLFERFYRADKSRSQKVGGTGLGLAIVKHIVALFDGDIKVESEEGKGTKFTVQLPL
ncbi:sensor histidine kinase [Sinanaerobacter sp. ZZT-01]|uniref:sensor histidine kinase n=1 Tax=Sinanaerobacter sp. ZZT-01 TaxID=3111540 RepID=UPI002D774F8F|nr:ATP-binding protein [Sinanaerobacter sp. ZZT-01]WRR94305.1 ATP-binding protein [Sinanaerobacter sp. ZZT-01]